MKQKPNLCKNTKMRVGVEMATYIRAHQFSRPATAGNKITPMDQYVSCRVTTIVRALPAVISETRDCK